jgi:hypothetical protein
LTREGEGATGSLERELVLRLRFDPYLSCYVLLIYWDLFSWDSVEWPNMLCVRVPPIHIVFKYQPTPSTHPLSVSHQLQFHPKR